MTKGCHLLYNHFNRPVKHEHLLPTTVMMTMMMKTISYFTRIHNHVAYLPQYPPPMPLQQHRMKRPPQLRITPPPRLIVWHNNNCLNNRISTLMQTTLPVLVILFLTCWFRQSALSNWRISAEKTFRLMDTGTACTSMPVSVQEMATSVLAKFGNGNVEIAPVIKVMSTAPIATANCHGIQEITHMMYSVIPRFLHPDQCSMTIISPLWCTIGLQQSLHRIPLSVSVLIPTAPNSPHQQTTTYPWTLTV